MSERRPGETTLERMKRTSLVDQFEREDRDWKEAERARMLQPLRRIGGGLSQMARVNDKPRLKVRRTESKLGIKFSLFWHKRSEEYYG